MIVEIEGLQKIYEGKQRVVAVAGIDLNVREGELYGLLGPNGAGKTTTISVCTTRALPTVGRVLIAGVDVVMHPALARRSIGVVPQYNTLDRSCTIFENIYFHCLYFGFSSAEAKARTEQLLAQFHLTERTNATPNQLSGGLAQRVQIARAIARERRREEFTSTNQLVDVIKTAVPVPAQFAGGHPAKRAFQAGNRFAAVRAPGDQLRK